MQPPIIIQFLDSGLDKELTREVKQILGGEIKGDIRLYRKTVILLGSYLLYYLIPFFVPVPPWLLIFTYSILAGLTMASIGMSVMHDANHESYSHSQKVNRRLGLVLYGIGGYLYNWMMQHNFIHHTYTNSEHDDDLGFGKLFRFSPNQDWKPHHRFQHLYALFLYPLMTILWITTKDFAQVARYKKEGRSGFENLPKHLFFVSVSKILYYGFWLVLPLIFWKAESRAIVLSFVGMHLVAGFTLAIVFQPAHVNSVTVFPSELKFRNKTEHQIMTSCNFAMKSKFITWFIGGLNFQTEHHLFPYISHVHYRKIAPVVQKYCKEKGLVYKNLGSLLSAIRDHFKFMKKLGDPNFV